jgi:alpha-tubulin suppressor-like RCC1 family protein
LTNAVAVAGGSGYSLALRADGTITPWGDGAPTLPSDLTNVVAVSAGGSIGLALKRDGTVTAWGTYWNGSATVPLTVPDGLTNVIAISAGGSHALALVGVAPPVMQAAVGSLLWQTNSLSLSVPTQSGRVYELDYKDSPSDPDWKPLPLAAGIGTERALTDLTATNQSRIYQIRRW